MVLRDFWGMNPSPFLQNGLTTDEHRGARITGKVEIGTTENRKLKSEMSTPLRPRGKMGVMRTQSPDTSHQAERVPIELLRQAPAWRRLQLTDRMSRTVRDLSLAGLRTRHPRATEAELRRRFADIHLGPQLAAKVYGPRPAD